MSKKRTNAKTPPERIAYIAAWQAANRDLISLRVPKGTKDRWKARAKAAGLPLSRYVFHALEEEEEW